ncbi:MAG TPA: hypothetical protein VHM65_05105, partial [Candidatus Lustribacter sp.]|nr:hypothetical protein [Candidatus Lustribacter sp.]
MFRNLTAAAGDGLVGDDVADDVTKVDVDADAVGLDDPVELWAAAVVVLEDAPEPAEQPARATAPDRATAPARATAPGRARPTDGFIESSSRRGQVAAMGCRLRRPWSRAVSVQHARWFRAAPNRQPGRQA